MSFRLQTVLIPPYLLSVQTEFCGLSHVIRCEENTRVFSRGMNPTTPRQSRWLDGIFHRSQTPHVNIEATINHYTDVQNDGSPPNPSSEDLQPRTGSGLA